MYKKIFAILLSVILLAGCAAAPTNADIDNSAQIAAAKAEIIALNSNLDEYSQSLVTDDFLNWLCDNFGDEVLFELCNTLKVGPMPADGWHTITGNTAIVLYDMYSGALDKNSPNYRDDIKVIEADSADTVIRIVGDVSFADNWSIMPKLEQRGKGVYGILSEETVELLTGADIFLLNNEFTFSNRGTSISGKAFTFRAAPERVSLLKDIGADIVSLANNHAYDYGADAFEDTLDILNDADVPYIGAGANITEAAKPYYFIVNGRKYGFSAATKAEKHILTPEAGEATSGVMRTYDPAKYIEVIKTAEQQCDYNIAYVHWGAEGSHKIEDGLYEMGSKYIDAGADIVVGAHAHVLQGIQYYNGVPIVYNLGNFIFNAETIDTAILEINISSTGAPSYRFIPAIQKNCYTQVVDGVEKSRILEFMRGLSIDVNFDDNGVFTEINN